MRESSIHRGPFILVSAGLALAAVGLAVLSLATFQKQSTVSGSTLGPGPISLTFTVLPMNSTFSVFLVVVMAVPLVLILFPWRFYLTTLVAPVFVALSTTILIVKNQLVSGLVVSSAGWVFVGDALVLGGCIMEAVGIVSERRQRTGSVGVGLPRHRPSRPAVSPPR